MARRATKFESVGTKLRHLLSNDVMKTLPLLLLPCAAGAVITPQVTVARAASVRHLHFRWHRPSARGVAPIKVTKLQPSSIQIVNGYGPGLERERARTIKIGVFGQGFRRGDVVAIGGKPERTRFVNASYLIAETSANDLDVILTKWLPFASRLFVFVGRPRSKAISNQIELRYSHVTMGG